MIPQPRTWNQRLFKDNNRIGCVSDINHHAAKRVMVLDGIIQPGYEEVVAAILAQSGMQLMPEHRRGTYAEVPKPYLVKAKRVKSSDTEVVVIPASGDEPEEYIQLSQLLEAEQLLNDSYEEDARRYDRPDSEVIGRKRAA